MSLDLDDLFEDEREESEDRAVVEETWTTKDGRVIPVSKMDDKHLLNTICFLAAEEAKTRILGVDVTGDPKIDRRFAEKNIKRMIDRRNMLVREARRRKLGEWAKFGMYPAAMEMINAAD